MLKIAHLGGIPEVGRLLQREQNSAGHVAVLLSSIDEAFQGFDIVHLHGIKTVAENKAQIIAANKIKKNFHFVTTCFEDDSNCTTGDQLGQDLMNCFSVIFSADTWIVDNLEKPSHYTWTAFPIESPEKITKRDYDNFEGEMLLSAFIHESSQQQLDSIHSALNMINEKQSIMRLDKKPSDGNCNPDADIFIDDFSAAALSYRSLCALAGGKTVLANIPSEFRGINDRFHFAPVLDTDIHNLEKRLRSVLSEPKSLRDFSTRSIEYIKQYHNPKVISDSLIEIYKQIVI